MTKNGIRIGIVGGTGYTGVELLRLLAQHPSCEIAAITSRKEAGIGVAEMFPNLRGRFLARSNGGQLAVRVLGEQAQQLDAGI